MKDLSDNPTKQEVYNHVLFGLREQKVASVDDEAACYYRDHRGNKCAVGQCIPDKQYRLWMDDTKSLHNIIFDERFPPNLIWMKQMYFLLTALQTLHDCYLPHSAEEEGFQRSVNEWEQNMERLAQLEGLWYTEP